MKYHELVAQNATMDAHALAALALKTDRDAVVGVVANDIERIRREQIRQLERSLIAPLIEAGGAVDFTEIEERHAFKTARGGLPITWLAATVEQHEARIAFLQKHIAGCERTIHIHEEAIVVIQRTGVTCLAEIPPAAETAA